MRFGVHSLMVVDEISTATAGELARTAAAWGADGVEIHVDDAEHTPVDALLAAADATGIGYTVGAVLTARNSFADPDPAVRQAGVRHLTDVVRCAGRLGAHHVGGVLAAAGRVFSGAPVTEAELDRIAGCLRQVAPVAEDLGVTVGVEPVNRYLGYVVNTAAQARELVDRVDSANVAVQLDTYHMNIEEASVPQGIRDAAGRIGYVQIAESHRGALGSGHIPWGEVLAALRAAGYDGWLTFEAFTPAHPDIAARSNTWRQLVTEERMVADGIPYLRGLL